MAKKSKRNQNRKGKAKIPQKVVVSGVNDPVTIIPQKVIVFGVNDPLTRTGWTIWAFLCVFGALSAVKAMMTDMDEDVGGYKYLGMGMGIGGYNYLEIVVGFLYLIQVLKSFFSEAPSPVYRAHRWVRTVVPLILFPIIYFTVFKFQTFAASLLILSIVFGIFVFVQLVIPIDGFHLFYVLFQLYLGCLLTAFAGDYDPKTQPFWFCFLTLLLFDMIIYYFNYPGPTNRAFSFY